MSWVPGYPTPEGRRAWAAFDKLLDELGTEMCPRVEDADRIAELAEEIDEAAREERARRQP
ncbi:hypothetical protein [Actinomadura alba]|uniref:Uncharacterized protein n=1 Tax=Actinomadura alba TaxID=406431 RepID=A0ABR7LHC7_9ACTN|nr:hypothetical protein [Actinomadura alba]MBC6464240.1 hypothetical protein [Actinomadura alba]